MSLNLRSHLQKHWQFFRDVYGHEHDAAQKHREFYDEYFAVLDMTGDLSQLADWSPDVCVMSGSLNTMAQEEALKVVAAAFEMANIGVVFNFLSDMPDARYRGTDTAPARRFHTTEVLRWCMQQTPLVQFRQDYLDGHDATIAMRHSA